MRLARRASLLFVLLRPWPILTAPPPVADGLVIRIPPCRPPKNLLEPRWRLSLPGCHCSIFASLQLFQKELEFFPAR
jgi:hypothetical protein